MLARRSFLSLSAAALGGALLPSVSMAQAPVPAAALRMGARIKASATAEELSFLRGCAAWSADALPALHALQEAVAADFRAGRIWKIAGVSFSRTEAAWFLHASDTLTDRGQEGMA